MKTRQWLICNMKMALTHQLTDTMIHQTPADVKAAATQYISKLSSIRGMTEAEAQTIVQECLDEAATHVVIFNSITHDGMGRQTKWLDLLVEELNEEK